ILNTLHDLKNSLNHALLLSDLKPKSLEEVRGLVGNGIRRLIEGAVGENYGKEATDKVFHDFMSHYQQHCADFTCPYEGITEVIAALRKRGYQTAVVSNKADLAVQELCHTFFDGLFDFSVGERPGLSRKPAPDLVKLTLETLQISSEKALYIGDSEVDIATAKNSGLDCWLVEWGFRSADFLQKQGGKIILSSPKELLSRLP
ncbi:MAG: HAD family hydrolase, partial [Lachnospiraceae bacterium]